MTAAPLAARSGMTIEETPLLQERNFGDLRGMPYRRCPKIRSARTSRHQTAKIGRRFTRALPRLLPSWCAGGAA